MCQSVKQPAHQEIPTGIPMALLPPSQVLRSVRIPHIPNQPTQQWHHHMNSDLRQHQVRKIAETLYMYHPIALQDPRVPMVIQYAVKVERTMFETATNQGEYYQLLAEKTGWIRNMLVERRRMTSAVAKKFLERTRVKNEVKRRVRMGGQ